MSKILIDEATVKLALDHSEPSILSPGWTLVRNEDIAALREALAEQPAPVQGWKLVPVEPTQKMLDAPPNAYPADALVTWKAMLAAAPQPAQQQEPVGYVAENGLVDWNLCAPPIFTDLYTSPSNQPGYQAMAMAVTRLQKRCLELEGKQPAQQEMPDDWFKGMPEEYRREAWRIKEQPAPVQEPVAWMHEWEDGERIPTLHPRDARESDKPTSVRPLVYGDTSPSAHRKPLMEEEMFEAIRPLYSSDKAARLAVSHSKDEYRAIEAKLKEKKTC